MNLHTQRAVVAGPAGDIECAITAPEAAKGGVVVICHPHPQHGGTMDNKVVQTIARAFVALGWRAVRFNFRGIGNSGGVWDEGRGEVDDALAVIAAQRGAGQPLVLAGFSFGAYVAASAARSLPAGEQPRRLLLVGPAVVNFDVAPVSQDTLVIHGEADDVVPLSAVLEWARPQVLPVLVVPGVGHFFHGQLPLLKSLVIRSFSIDT